MAAIPKGISSMELLELDYLPLILLNESSIHRNSPCFDSTFTKQSLHFYFTSYMILPTRKEYLPHMIQFFIPILVISPPN